MWKALMKESEKKDVPRNCEGIEKTMEHEDDVYTNCNWCY